MTQVSFNQKMNIAVAGSGAVGRCLIERLVAETKENSPFQLSVVAVRRERPWLKKMSVEVVDSPILLAQRSDIDIVVEVMGGVQDAYELAAASLTQGKHVVTANSTMLAHYGEQLLTTAQVNNRYLGFEAAVLAGLPLRSFFTSMQDDLPRVTAVLSSGLNRVLQRMQRLGESFDQAAMIVQKELPFDPSGKEDAYRLTLLRALLYGRWSDGAGHKGLHLSDLHPEDLALIQHLGGVVQVMGMVNASGVSFHPMVLQEEHALHMMVSHRESLFLELPVGPVQVTAPARNAAMATQSLLNDVRAACAARAWKTRQPVQAHEDLTTGCLFVRFNRIDQNLLRRDNRWDVLQERLDRSGQKVGAVISTALTPEQVMRILPNSLALPVWQPVGQEVKALDTPLRLVS